MQNTKGQSPTLKSQGEDSSRTLYNVPDIRKRDRLYAKNSWKPPMPYWMVGNTLQEEKVASKEIVARLTFESAYKQGIKLLKNKRLQNERKASIL